jgi:sensor histidine kinase regulating citrate/malate metabolism
MIAMATPESSRRLRLTVVFALLAALGTTLLVAHVALRLATLVDTLAHRHANAVAANVATLTQAAVATNDRIALAARLESFNEFGDVRAIVITDRQGEPLAAVQRNAAGNLSATLDRETLDERDDRRPFPDRWSSKRRNAPISIHVAIGQIAPIGWVHLEYDADAATAARQRLVAGAALVALLLVAALTTIFSLCLRRLLAAPGGDTQARSINSIL